MSNISVPGFGDGVNRPMTGIRGAGYPGTAAGGQRGQFDPMNQNSAGLRSVASPGIDSKREETPEEKIKIMEKKVDQFCSFGIFDALIILYCYDNR